MVSMLNYSGNRKELDLLKEQIQELAALHSDDKWDIRSFSVLKEVDSFLEEQPIINLSCYDITRKERLDYLRKVRKVYQKMRLMLIADMQMSPMEYIKPDVLASELILRPYTEDELKSRLHSLISAFLSQEMDEDVFILETKEEKIRIPYRQIYYLEACDKKVYVRLKREGKGFYGTLDALEESLPEYFMRCHRSYMVNWNLVEKVLRSQNSLVLLGGVQVPFSRSYKAEIMERMQ